MTTNATWRRVARLEALGEEPLAVDAAGEEVALYRVGDELFATANLCTHGRARLSDGWLEGHFIECPLHQGLFDVRTGRCAGPPVDVDLRTYAVRVVDGEIEIQI